jgi:hypothetical protein
MFQSLFVSWYVITVASIQEINLTYLQAVVIWMLSSADVLTVSLLEPCLNGESVSVSVYYRTGLTLKCRNEIFVEFLNTANKHLIAKY